VSDTESIEIVLVRHGETEWSRARKHTGRIDVPLTERGRREAEAAREKLGERRFALVLASPSGRALETAFLAGYGDQAQLRDDLMEWDYGADEGRTTAEIQRTRPGWSVWDPGPEAGETLNAVGARADRVVAEVRGTGGDVLIFAHGHLLRILAARWLGLTPAGGRLLALDPATISVLGYEHEWSVIRTWNASCGPA
jgi:broad specificity phosphatase PhoE